MAKYRILQEEESKFCPQEKLSIFHRWTYLDNRFPKYIWDKRFMHESVCSTLGQALEVISLRKKFLKEGSKYPIIHKVD